MTTTIKYYDKINCRCCGNSHPLTYLDLGEQPLANSYVSDSNIICPTVPLKVNLCLSCFHSQLTVVADPGEMFSNYLYVSGTTDTFRKHTQSFAEEISNVMIRHGKGPSDHTLVLDIACNDGTLLENFRLLGSKVRGCDPAKNLREITQKKNIDVDVEFFSEEVGKNYKDRGLTFDVITAQNVFAHVDDAYGFLLGIKHCLKENGLAVIEFPYAKEMITHNEFDTIYHEHLSYFLVNSFASLTKRTGFNIFKITQTPIHGGSIRFYLSTSLKETEDVELLIGIEKEQGLLDSHVYQCFATNVEYSKQEIKSLVEVLRKQNRKVVGYGASAKGNTSLNYFNLSLDYTVDDNKLKQGLYTPGQHIKIEDPKILASEDNPVIIVTAWNFLDEIKNRVSRIVVGSKSYILYVPDVRMI
jgi:SAM-dependent methyltransferase